MRLEEEENGNYLIISQVRPGTNQHLCKNTVWQMNQTEYTGASSPPINILSYILSRYIFLCKPFLSHCFFSGQPPRQWSVHLSTERLQTHGAPSHSQCQRSVKLASVTRRYVCPSVSILSRPWSWGQTHISSSITHNMRVLRWILECVAIPIAPQPKPDSFQVVLISV